MLRPLQLGQPRMEHGQPASEAAREALDQLRCERDLRHQDQRLQPVDAGGLDGGEVDLGLAAAGHPVQEHGLVAPHLGDRRALGGRQRPGRLGGLARSCRLSQQRAVPALARRGAGAARPAAADARRDHRANALQQRRPIMLRHRPRQLQLVRQQERFPVGALDRLQLDARVFAGDCQDVAPGRAAAEGHQHPVTRDQLHVVRHQVRVVTAVQRPRRLDRHLGVPDPGQALSLSPGWAGWLPSRTGPSAGRRSRPRAPSGSEPCPAW